MRTRLMACLTTAFFSALILPAVFIALARPTAACEYWVAPLAAGSNANPGTFAAPWATLDYASSHVPDNDCTVWFTDGT